MIPTAREVGRELKLLGSSERARASARFFKTGKGQYGYGDAFLGVTVPEQRKIAREYQDLPLSEVAKLLENKTHECRLTALLILVRQYERGSERERAAIVAFYLAHRERVNNWDLVDLSAPRIMGDYLLNRDRRVLYRLAKSENLWERRIAIVSTLAFICAGESDDTFAIAKMLLTDSHDLIHKATGWMLREVGKRVSRAKLTAFIDANMREMPRTMLRYAIEHYPPEYRKDFLSR